MPIAERSETTARCPICGTEFVYDTSQPTRELKICPSCGANGRSCAIIHLVCWSLLCNQASLCEQIQRKDLRVIGLSDGPVYSGRLKETFDYTNTFYHKEPLLDIRDPCPHWIETADLVIASEVFEHVIGPSQAAFDGAYRLLKPNGFLLLTVPYINHGNSLEHYPGLVRYESKKDTLGRWVAELVFEDGQKATDHKPRFHGGPGSTLELRLFNRERLLRELHTAGFVDIETFDEDKPELGINWGKPSRPILAKKPATP